MGKIVFRELYKFAMILLLFSLFKHSSAVFPLKFNMANSCATDQCECGIENEGLLGYYSASGLFQCPHDKGRRIDDRLFKLRYSENYSFKADYLRLFCCRLPPGKSVTSYFKSKITILWSLSIDSKGANRDIELEAKHF